MSSVNETIDNLIEDRAAAGGVTRARGAEGEFEFESVEGLAKARLANAQADALEGKQRLMRPLKTRLSDPNEP